MNRKIISDSDKHFIAQLWQALTAAEWGAAITSLKQMKAMGYTTTLISKQCIIPDNLGELINNPENVCFLEDLKKCVPLKKDELIYNKYLILSQLYSFLPIDKNSSAIRLLLTKRIENHANPHIEITLLSQDMPDFLQTQLALNNYCFGMSLGSFPGTTAFSIRVKADLNRLSTSAVQDSSLAAENYVSPLAGGSYATTAILDINDVYLVHKEARLKGFPKLRDEILWLVNLPVETKKLFPEIVDHYINEAEQYAWMRQKYYPWPSLTKYYFTGGFEFTEDYQKNAKEQFGFLNLILNKLTSTLYKVKIEDTPNDFFERFHGSKIRTRLQEAMESAPTLKELIFSPYVFINGEKMTGALKLINKFETINKYIGILNPPYLSLTHGDLNIGNILINPLSFYRNYSDLEFKLVDPRGWINIKTKKFTGQDYIYDVCKLAYHYLGDYDLVRSGMAYARKENDLSRLSYKILNPFDINDEFNMKAVFMYNCLKEEMLNFIFKKQQLLGMETGIKWKIRFFFTLGSMMISDIPFRLQDNDGELKAATIFLKGTSFLNLAWRMLVKEMGQTKTSLLSICQRIRSKINI